MVALNTLVGLGVGSLFMASPHFAWLMKGCGMGYICYLGWKLLFMQFAEGGKRLTFLEGVVLPPP